MASTIEELTGAAAINPGIEDVIANTARNRGNAPPADQTMVINMGPQHPSTHGVLRLVIEVDGETIVGLAPDIGYLHTGIEKTCEAKFYQQVVPLTDRIDYLCPMTNNLAYCLAVEKLLGLEIPERAQYLRVLFNELTRIQSHLVWLGTHAMDIGALFPRARAVAAYLRGRSRPADDDQLRPGRRPEPGTAA
jgi:NADH-quinone oxidoreductase subunit D